MHNYMDYTNWQQLRDGLIIQFRPHLTHFVKVAQLAQRRQQPNESAMQYIAAVQREFDEMGVYSEVEKVSIIQNGLNDRLRSVAMAQTWNSVRDMDLHLRSIESADELRKQTDAPTNRKPTEAPVVRKFYRRTVNAIDAGEVVECEQSDEEGAQEVEEEETEPKTVECDVINKKPNFRPKSFRERPPKPVVAPAIKKSQVSTEVQTEARANVSSDRCFNCDSTEHWFKDCDAPQQRVFCYRCGKDGVRTSQCPNCSSEKPKN